MVKLSWEWRILGEGKLRTHFHGAYLSEDTPTYSMNGSTPLVELSMLYTQVKGLEWGETWYNDSTRIGVQFASKHMQSEEWELGGGLCFKISKLERITLSYWYWWPCNYMNPGCLVSLQCVSQDRWWTWNSEEQWHKSLLNDRLCEIGGSNPGKRENWFRNESHRSLMGIPYFLLLLFNKHSPGIYTHHTFAYVGLLRPSSGT